MTLQEIFDQLSTGELSQVFFGEGGEAVDGIRKEDRLKALRHVKLGLTALHKRFSLREVSLTIGLIEGRQTYMIDKKYAASNTTSTAPEKYIQDTAEPYQEDLLKIERLYNDRGEEVPMNIVDDPESVRTISHNTLVIPSVVHSAESPLYKTETLKVVYRADVPKINDNLAVAYPAGIEIALSPAFLEPLLYFVASRVHTPIGISSEFHDGNNYASKYEMACQQLEQYGMALDSNVVNDRFAVNGWV